MSSIAAIRAAIRDVLAAVPGINWAGAYPPDNIGTFPAAFCGLRSMDVDYTASQEVNEHAIPVIVLVERGVGLLPSNVARAEVLEEAIRAAFRANVGLSGLVNLCMVERVQQDTIQLGQVPYLGVLIDLAVKDKYGVSLTV